MKKYFFIALIALLIFLIAFHISEEIPQNADTIIFIIDSQIDQAYLQSPLAKITADSSHGSKIAAIIRNRSKVQIKALAVENVFGQIDQDKYLEALEEVKSYSENNPDKNILVNISLGFSEKDSQAEIIEKMSSPNLLIIAAAGNNNSEVKIYPAGFEETIAVAALENSKKMAASNYGEYIDISAPGVLAVNQYLYLPSLNLSRTIVSRGSSFAAPQLTALISKMLAYNNELNPFEALEIVKTTASPIEDELYQNSKLGAGAINSNRALREGSPFYFYLTLITYTALFIFSLTSLIILWKKFSFVSLFIFTALAVIIILAQPFLIILYRELGFRIILFTIFMLIILSQLVNILALYYFKNTKNLNFLLFLSYYLGEKKQEEIIKRIVLLLNSSAKHSEEIIFKKLSRGINPKKDKIKLKILARLNKVPLEEIIKSLKKNKLKAYFIGEELNKTERNYTDRAVLTAELIYYLLNKDYKKQELTAQIIGSYQDELLLIPLKNILKKSSAIINNNHSLYFILEILRDFGFKAADFSQLLRQIFQASDDNWLKYYLLQAYKELGKEDNDYQQFLNKNKQKLKEPALLALENKEEI
ncbi:peptidase S8 and S53 subtilisin kexin sedolisin [Halanaerobium hydrogeniformans]|uniref:Peptidase S8 and S53 subtilisin kexin sedolisin n=1 Tax=Halanaerobium hydrogeniformans TaxID=656519 RepID=E4RN32_HALHG|nr:peptidase S8 and S53 subtilisin kexin sedolisin [Halanaerobium hydrogeniformans]